MPERLVDHIETVEVEEQQPYEEASLTRTAQRVAHSFNKECPVRKASEVVVIGTSFELLGCGYSVGNVACVEHDPANSGIVDEVLRGDVEMSIRTFFVRDAKRSRHRVWPVLWRIVEHRRGEFVCGLEVVGVNKFDDVDTVEAVRLMAKHSFDSRRSVDNAAVCPDQYQKVRCVLDQSVHPNLRFGDLGLRSPQFAYVASNE